MENLSISDVQPGRRLVRAVYSKDGRVLLLPGEVLTQESLNMLKEQAVKSVFVEPLLSRGPAQNEQSQPEDLLETARVMTAERFRLNDTSEPFTRALFDIAVERQSRALLSQAGKATPTGKPSPSFQPPRPPKANMRPLITAGHSMGTLPVVFQHLVTIINKPSASPDDIAKVIAMDTVLSARLLRMVNSPFFGLRYKIDTINRAVVLVGTRQVLTLAMGTTLITAFKGLPISLVNMRSFWSHSISCGAASRILAKHIGAAQYESYFVSGLLHDIGRLLIYTQLPNHALYLLTEAKRQTVSVYSLERETLGFTHEQLGGELLRAWNCPEELITRVEKHHAAISAASSPDNTVLPAANMLVQALGHGSSGEICVPPLSPVAWEKLNIPSEKLYGLCRELDSSVRELRALFAGAEQEA